MSISKVCKKMHVVVGFFNLVTQIHCCDISDFRVSLHSCVSCTLAMQLLLLSCWSILLRSLASVNRLHLWIMIFSLSSSLSVSHVEWSDSILNSLSFRYDLHAMRPHFYGAVGETNVSNILIERAFHFRVPSKHPRCTDARCLFSRDTRMATFAYLLGTRVGEASHPGPVVHSVKLAVINTAALYGKTKEVVGIPVDIFLCAETSVTKASQPILEKEFSQLGYRTFWSKMVASHTRTLDGRPSLRGEAIGSAVISKLPSRASRVLIPSVLWETCRISTAVVRVENIEIILISLYGFVENKNRNNRRLNDVLLAAALQIARESGLPFIIGGVFNSPPTELAIFESFKEIGVAEAFELSRHRFGKTLDPTCNGSTYNDTVLLHPFLAQRVRDIAVEHKYKFEPHSPLIVTFDFTLKVPDCLHWELPKSWSTFEPNEANIEYFYKKERVEIVDIISHIASAEDGDVAFEKWSGCVENAVHKTLAFQHRSDPIRSPVAGLPDNCRGRCQARSLKSKPVPQPPKSDLFGLYNPKVEVFSITNKHKVRQVRRLKSLIKARESLQTRFPDGGYPNALIVQQQNEWFAILRARGYGSSWQNWLLSFEQVSCVSFEIPAIETLKLFDIITTMDCDSANMQEQNRRRFGFKQKMQMDNAQNFGSLTYSMMKNKTNPVIKDVPYEVGVQATLCKLTKNSPICLRLEHDVDFICHSVAHFGDAKVEILTKQGVIVSIKLLEGILPTQAKLVQHRITTSNEEIFDEFTKFWRDKWLRDTPDEQFSADTWSEVIKAIDDCPLPAINVDVDLEDIAIWKECIKELKPKKAVGVCGWSHEELRMLPDCVLLDLIALIRAIMPFGFGPNMMQSRVTLLAKTPVPRTINDARPITILSAIYRLVSKIVFTQVNRAWIRVLPSQISGGLPGRGVRDLAFEQAQKIEQHVHAKLPLGGSSIDLVKAFNLIPRFPLARIFSEAWIEVGTNFILAEKS